MNVQTRLDGAEQGDFAGAGSREGRSSFQTSLLEIWQIAKIRARVIAGAAISTFVLIALVDLALTPLYKGTAVVMIDERQNKVVDVEQVLSGVPTDQPSI